MLDWSRSNSFKNKLSSFCVFYVQSGWKYGTWEEHPGSSKNITPVLLLLVWIQFQTLISPSGSFFKCFPNCIYEQFIVIWYSATTDIYLNEVSFSDLFSVIFLQGTVTVFLNLHLTKVNKKGSPHATPPQRELIFLKNRYVYLSRELHLRSQKRHIQNH